MFVVTGASGSGKTAVLPALAHRLRDRCVTFDADLLLDAAGAFADGRPINWTAFGDLWLAVAHGVAQSGRPTVLLGPFIPEHVQRHTARRWIGDIHYLVLDCPDEVRRTRISARPPWRSRDVEDQIEFGHWLRDHITDRVDTGTGTPDDTAQAIATWIDHHLAIATPPSAIREYPQGCG